jgi:ribonuclease BN (tRNA processing enzyme)
MARLFVLGAGGEIPTPQRQTGCYLLETRRGLVFFDVGTGLSRFHDPSFQDLASRSRRALILVSSWRLDRCAGLPWLPFFMGDLEVTLAGPAPGEGGATAVLERLLAPPFGMGLSAWRERFAGGLSILDLQPGLNRVGGEKVEARLQGDGDGLRLRVRDVVYAVGGAPDPATQELAAKAAVIIHEAWTDAPEEPGHATAMQAAQTARQSEAQDLILAHLNPTFDAGRLERLVFGATARFPRSVLAADMMYFKVTGVPDEEEAPAEEGAADSSESGEAATEPETLTIDASHADENETSGTDLG